MEFTYEYEKPVLAVDAVVFGFDYGDLKILLIKRGLEPFIGQWALPGGFVRKGESPDRAVRRELAEETGIAQEVFLEQLYTFGETNRDPRLRVISVAYYALIPHAQLVALAPKKTGTTMATLHVPWTGEAGGPVSTSDENGSMLALAFDHGSILGLAVKRLRGKLSYTPVALALLNPTFTLFDLQRVHEAILGRSLNKDSFRRKILSSDWVRSSGKLQAGVGHRPAELYCPSPTCHSLAR